MLTAVVALSAVFVATPHYASAQSAITTSWEWVTNNTSVQGGINVAGGTDTDKGDSIIQVIKNFINYVLWFLGLIALIMLLRWWFKMVTAWGDEEGYTEWLKVLKNAAIWIAFIGIAWFLVTFIFYIFSLVTR